VTQAERSLEEVRSKLKRQRIQTGEECTDDASGARRLFTADKVRKEEEENKRRDKYVKDERDGFDKPRGHTNSRLKRTEKVGSQRRLGRVAK